MINITSKSLHGANIVFLLNEKVKYPENNVFLSLFSGEEARGINFIDNSNVNLKVVEAPGAGLSVVLEGRRLRVEDRLLRAPEDPKFIETAIQIYSKLFVGQETALEGYGFNFDIYYQLKEVIRIDDIFSNINSESLEMGDSILNLGWQWTIANKDGRSFDGYFLKITAPMEIVVHHNLHHNEKFLPKAELVHRDFYNSFKKTHKHISGFML